MEETERGYEIPSDHFKPPISPRFDVTRSRIVCAVAGEHYYKRLRGGEELLRLPPS